MPNEHYPLEVMYGGSNSDHRPAARTRKRRRKVQLSTEQIRRFANIFLWIYMIVIRSLLVFTISVTGLYYNADPAEFDASNADFPLYKNSWYKACSASVSTSTYCTLLETTEDGSGHNFLYGPKILAPDASALALTPGDHVTWCELTSCLKDYIVVPSTPRRSAIDYTDVPVLSAILMVVVTFAWAMKERINHTSHNPQHCKGFGYITMISNLYGLCSTMFWWYSFVRIMLDDRNPEAISLIAWITTYRHAYDGLNCPTSCRLDKHPRYRRLLTWFLVFIAAAQFFATCYIYRVVWPLLGLADTTNLRRHDCLIPQSNTFPYDSSCTCEDVCAKTWLFADPGSSELTLFQGPKAFFSIPLMIAVAPLVPMIFAVADWRRRSVRDGHRPPLRKLYEMWVARDHGPHSMLRAPLGPITMALSLSFFFALFQILDIGRGQASYDRVATVAYDTQCLVVHVALSPWRQYLDVNDESRVWRIVKAWMNA